MISIIIPVRQGGNPEITLKSLAHQTYRDFEIIVSYDKVGNANWARNRGFEKSKGELVLFSDDDIQFNPLALDLLKSTLERHTLASYVYGAYIMDNRLYCNRDFDVEVLKRTNYISTMSLIHRDAFMGFNESIHRLQDWELWLRMLCAGKVGQFCGDVIFTTFKRQGITFGNSEDWTQARNKVLEAIA